MLEELKARAAQAVELALESGANDAWATASRGRSVEFSWRAGQLEKVQESTSRSLAIELYVDGRYSSHSTTDLRAERLGSFVQEAVALTRALQPDPHRHMPDPALFEGRAGVDLELVDPALANLTPEQRTAWCQSMDDQVRDAQGVISATSAVYDGHNLGASASSNGFTGDWEGTSVWIGTEVTVQDEGDKRPEGYLYVGGRHRESLLSAEDVARGALEQARLRLGSVQGPTRRATMVVDPRAAGRLLRALLSPANARAIQQGRSFWANKTDQRLTSEKLTIVDDPLLPRGLSSRYFDGEGIAARRMPLIEEGLVKGLYVDTYYGGKAGLTPTTGSASNRILALGERNLEQLMADAGDGIYVTSWLGGNSDPTSGDFSFGLRGHLIENGQRGAPVGEMNVTGNLMDLFQTLVEVGNDPWPYGSLRAPTLVFEGVQFSGR